MGENFDLGLHWRPLFLTASLLVVSMSLCIKDYLAYSHKVSKAIIGRLVNGIPKWQNKYQHLETGTEEERARTDPNQEQNGWSLSTSIQPPLQAQDRRRDASHESARSAP
jgi:hypothetical protein